jgi:ABC-type nitrate/sulfonate/bicarbonate transport system substrate-binding protein
MQPDAAHAALKSGQIDGFSETLPQPITAINDGSGALLSSGVRFGATGKGEFPELAPMALNGVMTRGDYCGQNDSICARFVEGIVQGMNFLHDNPKESLEILHKAIPGMAPDVLDAAFKVVVAWIPRKGASDDDRFAKAQEVMVTAGMIKAEEKMKSFETIYTNKYIK